MMNIPKTQNFSLGELSLVELKQNHLSNNDDMVLSAHKNRVSLILNSTNDYNLENNLLKFEEKKSIIQNFYDKEINKRLNDLKENNLDKKYEEYILKELVLAFKCLIEIIKKQITTSSNINEGKILKEKLLNTNNEYCQFLYGLGNNNEGITNAKIAFSEYKDTLLKQLIICENHEETDILRIKYIQTHQEFAQYSTKIGNIKDAVKEIHNSIDNEFKHKTGFALFEDMTGILYKLPIIEKWNKISKAKNEYISHSKESFNKEYDEGKKDIEDLNYIYETLIEIGKKIISSNYTGSYTKNGLNIFFKNGQENIIRENGQENAKSKDWKIILIMTYGQYYNFLFNIGETTKAIDITNEYNNFFTNLE